MPDKIAADRWYDYTLEVIDAVDLQEQSRAMEGYVKPSAATPDEPTRRDYFRSALSISKAEQARRFGERRSNPLKQWKLSPIDVEAQARWDAYTEAKEKNLSRTDTPEAPWTLVKGDDKLRARLETMRTVLHGIDYAGREPGVVHEPDPWIVAPASIIFAKPGPEHAA